MKFNRKNSKSISTEQYTNQEINRHCRKYVAEIKKISYLRRVTKKCRIHLKPQTIQLNYCRSKSTLHYSAMKLSIFLSIIGILFVFCETTGTELIECNERGSVSTALNADGKCECKANVMGQTCNECKPNTFDLSQSNPLGCTECICMGITRECHSLAWHKKMITQSFEIPREIDFENGFINLPGKFLKNRLLSYGGMLKLTINLVSLWDPDRFIGKETDIEIISASKNITLRHSYPTPLSSSFSDSLSTIEKYVIFNEYEWHLFDDSQVSKSQFLTTIAAIDTIRIKIVYGTLYCHITEVSLETAVEEDNGSDLMYYMEKCDCPVGYTGTSCEECADGYFRRPVGIYLGICEKNTCNGHSSQWDEKTGFCENCQHNTAGEHCHLCAFGYEGNAMAEEGCEPPPPAQLLLSSELPARSAAISSSSSSSSSSPTTTTATTTTTTKLSSLSSSTASSSPTTLSSSSSSPPRTTTTLSSSSSSSSPTTTTLSSLSSSPSSTASSPPTTLSSLSSSSSSSLSSSPLEFLLSPPALLQSSASSSPTKTTLSSSSSSLPLTTTTTSTPSIQSTASSPPTTATRLSSSSSSSPPPTTTTLSSLSSSSSVLSPTPLPPDCNCDSAESQNNRCNGVCIHKQNLDEETRVVRKAPTFGLSAYNAYGCKKCFCSGMTMCENSL